MRGFASAISVRSRAVLAAVTALACSWFVPALLHPALHAIGIDHDHVEGTAAHHVVELHGPHDHPHPPPSAHAGVGQVDSPESAGPPAPGDDQDDAPADDERDRPDDEPPPIRLTLGVTSMPVSMPDAPVCVGVRSPGLTPRPAAARRAPVPARSPAASPRGPPAPGPSSRV